MRPGGDTTVDERSTEGLLPGDDSGALMVPPDDEGMPTPRAVEQVKEAEERPRGDVPPDSD